MPAFVILKIWKFDPEHMAAEYWTATALMILGGLLGIMFVTILRRVMVEDASLPFPESVAAAEIHKAGQRGQEAAAQLFKAMGVGAVIKLLGDLGVFRASNTFSVAMGNVKESFVRLGLDSTAKTVPTGGVTTMYAPAASPAYIGVGYIIGPELGALNFAGGLLAWGLFVPLLVFFLGPALIGQYTGADGVAGLGRADQPPLPLHRAADRGRRHAGRRLLHALPDAQEPDRPASSAASPTCRKSAAATAPADRTERDLPFKTVLLGIAAIVALMIGLYFYFTQSIGAALLAALVMLVTGFFFSAVSGNLVGMIGSSNNPISGLTLATTIVAALTMVIVGAKGIQGVAAVLGVAAIGCVSAAVAGEMLQDLKVGHILGGTPWKMQVGDVIGVVVAGLVMFFPLYILHVSDLKANPGIGGFGGPNLAAPAGRPDGGAVAGHRRRRDGLAAGAGRHRDGHLADPGQGQEPDALLGRHVPAARDHLRDLRRRHDPRLRRQARATSAASTRRRRRGSRTPACWSPPA